jgi:predicted permease
MDRLLQDLRYAIRSFGRNPGLTLIAVLSLGAGIGASATVFTWLRSMVLDPIPAVTDYERVVVARTRAPGGGTWSVSWPDFRDWRGGMPSADLAAFEILQLGLRSGDDAAERAWGMMVSGNYFDALDVAPALGRLLRADDEAQRAPVAVLGHDYWQRRFGGDSGVVGRTIALNGAAFTIVGVAAPRFGGTSMGLRMHLFVPITTLPLLRDRGAEALDNRQDRMFDVVGKLAPGVTVAQAAPQLDALARRAGADAGVAQPTGALLRWYGADGGPAAMRPVLGALLVVAGLVLLIACANVANLLLARAIARRREIAVRLAVGASRWRLIRQLLTESLVLAALAGIAGLLLAFWGRDLLLAMLPAVPYPVGIDFPLDRSVVLFAMLVTAAAAVAFGLMPALRASRPELVPTLKDEIGEGHGGRGRLQGALVAAQVALSLVTLVSAGLFLRSLNAVRALDTGMRDLDRVLLVGTEMGLAGIRNDSTQVAVARQLLERVRLLPGVEAASFARAVPLGPGPLNSSATRIEGYTPRRDENMNISHNDVATDYFRTAGVRMLAGRDFSDADLAGNAPVVIVNEAFARRFLGGRSAVGARINVGGDEWLSVVGVVATTKIEGYTEDPMAVVYRPYSVRFLPATLTLHVRTAGDPLAHISAIRAAYAEVSAELPVLDPRNMAEFTTLPYYPQKLGATMLAAVGIIALLLAAIGIYGAMAYAVSRRIREIGVRVALGAARRDVVRLVLGRGMRITGAGLAVGLLGALGIGQALRSQLWGISPRDPLTFGAVGLVLAAVALAACLVPARRAARVDPMVALRSE